MLSPELTNGILGGFIAGASGAFGFMRLMIRSALKGFELDLTNKYDKRYHMLPQRQER